MEAKNTYQDAYEYSINLISSREVCVYDLKNKLKKRKIPEPDIEQLVQELTEKKWLNETRYTECFVKEYSRRKKGALWIKNALLKKKIALSVLEIQKIQNDFDLKPGSEEALSLLLRKYPDFDSDQKNKAKAWRGLASRGFTSDDIQLAFQKAKRLRD